MFYLNGRRVGKPPVRRKPSTLPQRSAPAMPAWEAAVAELNNVKHLMESAVETAERGMENLEHDPLVPREGRPVVKQQHFEAFVAKFRGLREREKKTHDALRAALERETAAPDALAAMVNPTLHANYSARLAGANAQAVLQVLTAAPLNDGAADEVTLTRCVEESRSSQAIPYRTPGDDRLIEMQVSAGGTSALGWEMGATKVLAELVKRRDARRSPRSLEAAKQLAEPVRPLNFDDRIGQLARATGNPMTASEYTRSLTNETDRRPYVA